MTQEDYLEWLKSKVGDGNFPYYNPAPKVESSENDGSNTSLQFPIVASGLKYNNGSAYLPFENLKECKEAGFNICAQGAITTNWVPDTKITQVRFSLSNARELNMKLMFSVWSFGSKDLGIKDTFCKGETICNAEYFGGICLADEPTYATIVDPPGNLKETYKDFIDQETDYLFYINLIGSPVASFMPESVNPDDSTLKDERTRVYKKYVQAFQDNFRPSLFSYDLYPFRQYSRLLYQGIPNINFWSEYNGIPIKEGTIVLEEENFFRDLDVFSEFGKKYNRPFWIFSQSMHFMVLTQQLARPVATENFLRYEIFMALAYGVQGVNYWTYCMRENNGTEAYFSALLNRDGGKTASWYYAKKINEEIQTYRHVFLNSSVDKVTVLSPEETFEFTLGTCSIHIISEKKIRVSHLKNENGDFIMVVNESPFEYQNIHIMVGRGQYVELTPEKSGGEPNQPLQQLSGCSRILTPGGYRIFQISSGWILPGQ